jgi:hypothetical protein
MVGGTEWDWPPTKEEHHRVDGMVTNRKLMRPPKRMPVTIHQTRDGGYALTACEETHPVCPQENKTWNKVQAKIVCIHLCSPAYPKEVSLLIFGPFDRAQVGCWRVIAPVNKLVMSKKEGKKRSMDHRREGECSDWI